MRKSSTPSRQASSKSHMYWRTASAVPWNHSLVVVVWLAASTSTKPRELYPPTLEFWAAGGGNRRNRVGRGRVAEGAGKIARLLNRRAARQRSCRVEDPPQELT
jgi:hypothetical protein